MIVPYIIRFALIDQATQETFRVIPYISSGVTKHHVRIIAITQDSCPFDIKRQRVLQPVMVACQCRVLPSARRVSVKSMDCDDDE